MDTEFSRRLVLLRHAKSAYPADVADHDRPLAARGRRDAPLAGRWLARSGYVPDAVVCSTALRARETWNLVAGGLADSEPARGGLSRGGLSQGGLSQGGLSRGGGAAPTVRYEPRVYEATVLALLMLVREFPDSERTVLVVGHNPGLAELAVGLAAPSPRPPAAFPTSAAAVLGLTGPWASAGPGEATLLDFAAPAQMRAA